MLIDITKVDVLKRLDVLKTRRRIADALPKTATAEQLVEIAKILGVQVALVSKRPHFGANQVRDICQLRKGMTYRYMHTCTGGGSSCIWIFTVIEEPYFSQSPEASPGWWVKGRYKDGREDTISLQDSNVVPYDTGKWNESNYLAFTDQSQSIKFHPHYCCSCHDARCPNGGHEIVHDDD